MTISVDFDGVIHQYSQGWQDGTIYDPPMPGALDGLRMLMEYDAVFILTTRDVHQVATWLNEHGIHPVITMNTFEDEKPFWHARGTLLVTNRKLAANVYLDDRALHFTTWERALRDILPGASEPEPSTDHAVIAGKLLAELGETRRMVAQWLFNANMGYGQDPEDLQAEFEHTGRSLDPELTEIEEAREAELQREDVEREDDDG